MTRQLAPSTSPPPTRRHALGALALAAFATLAVLATTALLPAQAHAQSGVKVVIRTIHATTDTGSMDGRLEPLAMKLTKAFQGYEGFLELSRQDINITAAAPFSFVLPDGTRFRLDFKGQDGDLFKLGVGVGKRFDTDMRASAGSTFFQAGLPHTHEGRDGILIIAVTVE